MDLIADHINKKTNCSIGKLVKLIKNNRSEYYLGQNTHSQYIILIKQEIATFELPSLQELHNKQSTILVHTNGMQSLSFTTIEYTGRMYNGKFLFIYKFRAHHKKVTHLTFPASYNVAMDFINLAFKLYELNHYCYDWCEDNLLMVDGHLALIDLDCVQSKPEILLTNQVMCLDATKNKLAKKFIQFNTDQFCDIDKLYIYHTQQYRKIFFKQTCLILSKMLPIQTQCSNLCIVTFIKEKKNHSKICNIDIENIHQALLNIKELVAIGC